MKFTEHGFAAVERWQRYFNEWKPLTLSTPDGEVVTTFAVSRICVTDIDHDSYRGSYPSVTVELRPIEVIYKAVPRAIADRDPGDEA